MATKGRYPRQSALDQTLGNPGHDANQRRLADITPPGEPEKPEWVTSDTEASAEWDRVLDFLLSIGRLSAIDRTALATYCLAVSSMIAAEQAIRQKGLTQEGRFGLVAAPEVGISQRYMGLIKQYCAEFGLTPSARGRMAITSDTDKKDEGGLD